MTQQIKNDYNFSELANYTPKQLEASALSKQYKYLLYGGAKGGGKSRFLRWKLLELLLWWGGQGLKGVRVGLFCEDYPTLKDRQITKIVREFPPWLGVLSNSSIHGLSFQLAPQFGEGILALRNLDDPSKYASSEFAAIGVDELTKNPYETFQDLRSVLRWVGIEDVKFLGGTNPGGIGHVWCKNYFINKTFPQGEMESDQFCFVPSKHSDNPYNAKTYVNQLMSLDEKLRKAYLDGNWDIFEGQYFDEFNRDIHVVKPFEIPISWDRYICMDYGWTAPSAVVWVAVDPDGRRYAYRELYVVKHTPDILAEEIAKNTPYDEIAHIIGLFADPSIWNTKAGENTIASMMETKFVEKMFHVKLSPANNDRIAGAMAIREDMRTYQHYDGIITSKFLIFETCKYGVETIPALTHSKLKPEDVETKGEDHWYDAIRYGRMSYLGKTESVKAVIELNQKSRSMITANQSW